MHMFTQALLAAEQNRTPVPAGTPFPQTAAEAHAIQFEFIDNLGGHAGWKISPWTTADAMLAAPIPRRWIYSSPARVKLVPGARLEVEFALIRQPSGEWHVALAFEFVRSRLSDGDWSPMARRADLLSGGGLVYGPSRPLAGIQAGNVSLALSHDGVTTAEAVIPLDPEALLAASNWLNQHANLLSRAIEPDTVVITGARIGPLPITPGTYVASTAAIEPVTVIIEA